MSYLRFKLLELLTVTPANASCLDLSFPTSGALSTLDNISTLVLEQQICITGYHFLKRFVEDFCSAMQLTALRSHFVSCGYCDVWINSCSSLTFLFTDFRKRFSRYRFCSKVLVIGFFSLSHQSFS